MKNLHTILVADRNPHVRKFLERELGKDGYRVFMAATGEEALELAYGSEPIDLLILDPDLPGPTHRSLMEKLENRIPALPVVVHGIPCGPSPTESNRHGVAYVEKEGGSIESLRKAITDAFGT